MGTRLFAAQTAPAFGHRATNQHTHRGKACQSNTHHKASGVECHAALQEVPQQSREDGHVRNVQHLQWQDTEHLACNTVDGRRSDFKGDPTAA